MEETGVTILILAGGGGKRLWPLSCEALPKQFLRLDGGGSLLQKTLQRFFPIARRIAVVTQFAYKHLIEAQLAELHMPCPVHMVFEPLRRNTLGAAAWGIKSLEEECGLQPTDQVFMAPADHLLHPEEVLRKAIAKAEPSVCEGRIVLFGISPSRPETGYGYIQIGEPEKGELFAVKRFVEKPERSQAEAYLAAKEYYWNSGMLACTVQTFWQTCAEHVPQLREALGCKERFASLPDLSFDYGLLEKTVGLLMIPLAVSWSDVGSWDSVYDVLAKDRENNAKQGSVLDIDTRNCLIMGGKKTIAAIGLEDLFIVDTEEALLIGKRGSSQRIREFFAKQEREQKPEECQGGKIEGSSIGRGDEQVIP